MGKRGLKTCPKCSTGNGPRAFKCKQCEYDFKPGEKRKSQPGPKGVGRGQKMCPNCKGTCGPRSYACPHCQFEFKPGVVKPKLGKIRKRKKNKLRVKDWKTLEVGNRVKVLKGSGDYYISKDNGERVYMQDSGVYYVEGIKEDGLAVRGKNGHGFIYMGKPKTSNVLKSIQKEPAKLVLFVDH